MSITVLGCDGGFPGIGGACSGYLLQCVNDSAEGTRIWIDAGSGSMSNLQRHISLDDVDAVVISHEHPDHWGDLEGFAVASQYELERMSVPVYAPSGLKPLVYHGSTGVFDWRIIADSDRVIVKDITLTFSRTDHGPETLAVRADALGRSFAYSADTGPNWSFEALGSGFDLVLCEATFTKEREGRTQHLSARQAAEMAQAAKAARLVLTHKWPFMNSSSIFDEGSSAFGSQVSMAEANKVFQF
ncbi:MAG: MBL fold metallo-hydrolase [Actinobacteria bacterium]|nr:MBL fold metallo-hydrolase [Actinomycetota bacterium]MCL6105495.1 MBL fold metallo-hydrolase [Actinomycetota bacterium]